MENLNRRVFRIDGTSETLIIFKNLNKGDKFRMEVETLD
jgi:hypothetical protein